MIATSVHSATVLIAFFCNLEKGQIEKIHDLPYLQAGKFPALYNRLSGKTT